MRWGFSNYDLSGKCNLKSPLRRAFRARGLAHRAMSTPHGVGGFINRNSLDRLHLY